MSPVPYDLDVRPILREGGEPFSVIMGAVAGLAPGQPLRLLATFKPIPLFQVLGARGFEAAAREAHRRVGDARAGARMGGRFLLRLRRSAAAPGQRRERCRRQQRAEESECGTWHDLLSPVRAHHRPRSRLCARAAASNRGKPRGAEPRSTGLAPIKT